MSFWQIGAKSLPDEGLRQVRCAQNRVNGPEDIFMFFRIHGAWNNVVFNQAASNLPRFLTMLHSDPAMLGELLQNLRLETALVNLPYPLFQQLLTNDEDFLKRQLWQKEDVQREIQQYSGYEDSEIVDLKEANEEQGQSLDLSGIDPDPEENPNRAPQRKEDLFEEKLNFIYLVQQYAEHLKRAKRQIDIKDYFSQQLLLSLWFGSPKFDKYLWQRAGANFIQRKFALIDSRILVVADSESADPHVIAIAPLEFSEIAKLPQVGSKVGFSVNQTVLNLREEFYFDSLNEITAVLARVSPSLFSESYTTTQQGRLVECVNKKLGQKMSVLTIPNDKRGRFCLQLHHSVNEFPGVCRIHDWLVQPKDISIVIDRVQYTLEDYKKLQNLNEFQTRLISQQLLTILKYLEFRGIKLERLTPDMVCVVPSKDEVDQISRVRLVTMRNACYDDQLHAQTNLISEVLGNPLGSKLMNDFMEQSRKQSSATQLSKHAWFADESVAKQAFAQMQILK